MKLRTPILLGSIFSFGLIAAQARQGSAPKPASNGPTTVMNLTAKSANVSEPGTPVRINILRWSTDEERLPMLAALKPELAPPPAARGGRGGRGRGAQPNDVAPDPAL